MLIIKKGILQISEQTLKELMFAIEKAKKEIQFIKDPMPDYDMSPEQYNMEQCKRGIIHVVSDYAPLDFQINIEVTDHTQESVGYHLVF
jgi:hypothetical protein